MSQATIPQAAMRLLQQVYDLLEEGPADGMPDHVRHWIDCWPKVQLKAVLEYGRGNKSARSLHDYLFHRRIR